MAENKNICITINSLASGGAEKQSMLLAKALKAYHNPILVILNPHPIYLPRLKVIEEDELDHIFLSKNPIKKTVEFIKLLKRKKIDIIFSFLPTDTILAAFCGKAASVPYIFGGIRTNLISGFKYIALMLTNNYLLDYTISNNFSAYHSAITFGFKKNILVIPNGIEIRPLSLGLRSDRQMIRLISTGRLAKSKDFKTSLQSVAELKRILKGSIKLKYIIIGQGPEEKNILQNIEKYELKDEVELITKPANIYELLDVSDIYISTSLIEGISNSIMEAMNCALPIVATDAGDNARLVIHGKNGFITGMQDYKKFAEHLHYLIEYPKVRNQMGMEGYNYLSEEFSFSSFQQKYVSIINHIEAIQLQEGNHRFGEESSVNSE